VFFSHEQWQRSCPFALTIAFAIVDLEGMPNMETADFDWLSGNWK
jgi:hypothetical protein